MESKAFHPFLRFCALFGWVQGCHTPLTGLLKEGKKCAYYPLFRPKRDYFDPNANFLKEEFK